MARSHFTFPQLRSPARLCFPHWSLLPLVNRDKQGWKGHEVVRPRFPATGESLSFHFISSQLSPIPSLASERDNRILHRLPPTPPTNNHGPISVCAVRHRADYLLPGFRRAWQTTDPQTTIGHTTHRQHSTRRPRATGVGPPVLCWGSSPEYEPVSQPPASLSQSQPAAAPAPTGQLDSTPTLPRVSSNWGCSEHLLSSTHLSAATREVSPAPATSSALSRHRRLPSKKARSPRPH
jgi:hypothetical protein